MISALPTSRAYNSLMTLMPNAVAAGGAASDAQTVPGMVVFGGAGGRGNEGRLQLDGLSVGSAFNGAGVSAYIPDIGNAQEISMVSSGGLGEAEVGGPTMNIVPKEGGNTIARSVLYRRRDRGDDGQQLFPGIEGPRPDHAGGTGADSGTSTSASAGQSSETASGSSPACAMKAVIGPCPACSRMPTPAIRRSGRTWRITSRPAVHAASYRNLSLRLTGQATPRNKFNVFWDEQAPCEGGATPEVASDVSACRRSGDGESLPAARRRPRRAPARRWRQKRCVSRSSGSGSGR